MPPEFEPNIRLHGFHIQSPKVVRTISGLHDGEIDAIALFEELAADILLIDDRAGNRELPAVVFL